MVNDPAAPSSPRPGVSLRLKLLALLALGLAALLAHQAWQYHRLEGGDPFAANDLLLWRACVRRVAATSAAPRTRAAMVRVLASADVYGPLPPLDVRTLTRAAGDPDPLVRAAALDGLLTSSSDLGLIEAVELLSSALADRSELPAAELEALRPSSGWWLAAAGCHAEQRPGEPFRVDLLAAALTAQVDDPPELAFTPDVLEDQARRKAIEAAIPPPFLQRPALKQPGGWDAAVDAARDLLTRWRPFLLEHEEPATARPGVPLDRLRAALAGHPTHDPARHIAAITSAHAAGR